MSRSQSARGPRPRIEPTRAMPLEARVRPFPSPRYYQVYVTLRAWVRDGTYRPGAQIPTEGELCAMFAVSRITVRKAVDELVRERWLVRHQGRGTFVEMSAARPPAALELAPGVLVQKATHVRLLRGVPLAFVTTFVPLDIAHGLARGAGTTQPMLTLIARSGIQLAEAEQWIGATLAGVETARILDIEVGAPLLRITRVVEDEHGRPVERVVALYRADAYQYRMHLGRSARVVAPRAPRKAAGRKAQRPSAEG